MPDQANGNDQQQGGGTRTAEISGTVQIKQPEDGAKQQQGSENKGGNGKEGDDQKQPEPEKRNPLRTLIIICVVLLVILAAGFFYWRSTFTEDTDDAQVDGNLYQVSSRITGQVIKVYVDDNEAVQAGQVIAEIDPKDYQVALEQAKANLAAAEADAISANVNVPITSVNTRTQVSTTGSDVRGGEASVAQSLNQTAATTARVDQARANYAKAQLDVDRYTPLVQKDVISKQQYDAAIAQAAATKAAVIEAEAQVVAQQEATRQAQQRLAQSRSQAEQSIRTRPQQIEAQRARADSMRAQVQQARARVSRPSLTCPIQRSPRPSPESSTKRTCRWAPTLLSAKTSLPSFHSMISGLPPTSRRPNSARCRSARRSTSR